MKVKLYYIVSIISLCTISCVYPKYLYIKNMTDQDIEIYETVNYGSPSNDSLINRWMRANAISNQQRYHTILKKDSILFVEFVYGKKSNTELIDSLYRLYIEQFIVISKSDTIIFNQKDIIRKINEVWAERNSNPSVKLKRRERNRLIWEFR